MKPEERKWPNGEPVQPATHEQMEVIRKQCAPYLAIIELMMEQLWITMPVCDARWNFLMMREKFLSWKASLGRFGAQARCNQEAKQAIMDTIACLQEEEIRRQKEGER